MKKTKTTIQALILSVAAMMLFIATPSAKAAGPLGKRIVLKNGMVLLLAEKHEIPMVTVSMAIKAGGVAEPADKPGLASLTAALMTQGTTSRSANQISREIDFIGGSLSVSGGDDYASAGLRVLKKDLVTGLDLLSDVLMRPALSLRIGRRSHFIPAPVADRVGGVCGHRRESGHCQLIDRR
ncbi:MAG: insulinase family protein [Nitrospirae bacterium]|nr:insulinase family protein [Nitrospirota bacterium]